MLLKDKYFSIDGCEQGNGCAQFHVRLLLDCDVYRGHFPGNPVSPGVCNIEMIKECFDVLHDGEPRIKTIDRCRLTAVASPAVSPNLTIDMSWTKENDGWHLIATLKDNKQQYMDFKGTLE